MRFRNNSEAWSAWESFSSPKYGWGLNRAFVSYNVTVEVSDALGNTRQRSDSVLLDDAYEGCMGNNNYRTAYNLDITWQSDPDQDFFNQGYWGAGWLYDEDWFRVVAPKGSSPWFNPYYSTVDGAAVTEGEIEIAVFTPSLTLVAEGTIYSGTYSKQVSIYNCGNKNDVTYYLRIRRPKYELKPRYYNLVWRLPNDGCL